MSLAAVIDAMIASGCTPAQIGAAVRASEDETRAKADAEVAARRARAAEKKALQRAAEAARRAAIVAECPEDTAGHEGTTGDVEGQKRKTPTPPKEKTTPPPSAPKGASVGAPTGASRGHRLAEDWQPNESDLDYGQRLGLRPADIASSLEDMQRWAWANTGPKVRKLDWHMTFKGFLKRDAGRANARAGPPRNGNARTVADMARMNLDHDEPDIFDGTGYPDHQPASDARDDLSEGSVAGDENRSGYAGRLSLEASAVARRGVLVDH